MTPQIMKSFQQLFVLLGCAALFSACAGNTSLRRDQLGSNVKVAVMATARIKGEIPYDRVLVLQKETRMHDGLTSWTKYDGVAVRFGDDFRLRAARKIAQVLQEFYQAEVVLPGEGDTILDTYGLVNLPDYNFAGNVNWKAPDGSPVEDVLPALKEKGIDYLLLYVITTIPALRWPSPEQNGRLSANSQLTLYDTSDGSLFFMPPVMDMLAQSAAWEIPGSVAPGCSVFRQDDQKGDAESRERSTEEILLSCSWEDLEPALLSIVARSVRKYLTPATEEDSK